MDFELLDRIELLIEHKKYKQAEQLTGEALAMHPQSDILNSYMADIYLSTNRSKDALQFIEKAIASNPVEDEHFFTKSKIHLDLNQYQAAEEAINQAILLFPDASTYYGVKAAILMDTGKRQEALTTVRQGLAIRPDDGFCKNVLSMVLAKTGKGAASIEVAQEALNQDPDDSMNHASMGFTYLHNKEIDKAKHHFQQALMLNPNSDVAREGLTEAIKASNWFYRKNLELGFWIDRLGSKKWIFYLGLIFLVQIVPFLLPIYLVFILWSWFAPPIAEIILLMDKNGKHLLRGIDLKTTKINAALLVFAIVTAFALTPLMGFAGLVLALTAFLLIIPVYMLSMYNNSSGKQSMVYGFIAAFVVFGGLTSVSLYTESPRAETFGMLFILSVIAFTWVVASNRTDR